MLSKQLENQLLEIFLEYVKPSNLHKGMQNQHLYFISQLHTGIVCDQLLQLYLTSWGKINHIIIILLFQ